MQRKLKENNNPSILSVCIAIKPNNYAKLLPILLCNIFTKEHLSALHGVLVSAV